MTNHNMPVTAPTAKQIKMMGYMRAPFTLRVVARESAICLFNSPSTVDICPVISPVRMISTQWCWKTLGKLAAAECTELPAATRVEICSSTRPSLTLWVCWEEICRACSSGVPEETRVANC